MGFAVSSFRSSITSHCLMSKTTVLVGFAEAMAAPEVAWSLVDDGFRVVAFARKGRASALRHSRYVEFHEICPPEVDLQASVSDLNSLLVSMDTNAESAQQILFPLDDKAVWLASKASLGNHWLLAGPSGTNAELALNKCLQVQAAREAGFNVPETLFARNAKDVLAYGATEPFPIILKASECVPVKQGRVQSCRKWICANRGELERAVSEWAECAPLLVQPFIEGTGEGVFGLAAPEGVRAWSAHRRVRMMNPQGSGSSACVSQSVPDDVKVQAEALIASTGWRGVFMIELLRDRAGKSWFVELNGRPWGSMALSRCQGLEYPAWNVALAMDEQSRVGMALTPTVGLVCRHVGREFMHLLFVLRGAKSKALRGWPSFWKAMGDVLRVHPGDGYYNWRRDDLKVFFADCYYTIHDNLFKAKT
jgi:predicted ATP-grasp superfamily ATP-dependent carboligase